MIPLTNTTKPVTPISTPRPPVTPTPIIQNQGITPNSLSGTFSGPSIKVGKKSVSNTTTNSATNSVNSGIATITGSQLENQKITGDNLKVTTASSLKTFTDRDLAGSAKYPPGISYVKTDAGMKQVNTISPPVNTTKFSGQAIPSKMTETQFANQMALQHSQYLIAPTDIMIDKKLVAQKGDIIKEGELTRARWSDWNQNSPFSQKSMGIYTRVPDKAAQEKIIKAQMPSEEILVHRFVDQQVTNKNLVRDSEGKYYKPVFDSKTNTYQNVPFDLKTVNTAPLIRQERENIINRSKANGLIGDKVNTSKPGGSELARAEFRKTKGNVANNTNNMIDQSYQKYRDAVYVSANINLASAGKINPKTGKISLSTQEQKTYAGPKYDVLGGKVTHVNGGQTEIVRQDQAYRAVAMGKGVKMSSIPAGPSPKVAKEINWSPTKFQTIAPNNSANALINNIVPKFTPVSEPVKSTKQKFTKPPKMYWEGGLVNVVLPSSAIKPVTPLTMVSDNRQKKDCKR